MVKIDYMTMASTGNAVDFGDLQHEWRLKNGECSSTRWDMEGGTILVHKLWIL